MDFSTARAGYLTEAEFADAFGNHVRGKPYHRQTLIGWRRRGSGPPWFKVGRDVVYSVEAAMRWLRSREVGS